MAEPRRVQRSEKELRHRIAEYLVTGYKGRLHGLVTVSHVKMSPDLKYADVYVSVLGSPEDKRRSFESLEDHLADVQRYVAKNWFAKFTPKLRLHDDPTEDERQKVDRILKSLLPMNVSESSE